MKHLLFFALLLTVFTSACKKQQDTNGYLGLAIPINAPEVFAPGTISNDSTGEGLISVSLDGKTIVFPRYFYDSAGNINREQILTTRFNGTHWMPAQANNKAQFYSTPQFITDSLAIMASSACIWQSTIVNDSTWTAPAFIDSLDLSPANGVSDWSVSRNKTLYYVQNGKVISAKIHKNRVEILGVIDGLDGFKPKHIAISADESFMVIDGFMDNLNTGNINLFMAARKPYGDWTEAFHLDSLINTKANENYLPRLSPDGKVLFFCRQDSANYGNVYWLGTEYLMKI